MISTMAGPRLGSGKQKNIKGVNDLEKKVKNEPTQNRLLGGAIVLRPNEDGSFDELLMYDGEKCLVHAEMMDNKSLWIGFYPGGDIPRVCMWISAKGKLTVRAEED
jgi:hypothetical protein